MEIRSHGAHQLALRRRSVKVFVGAMNVSMMRAPWESGAGSGAGTDADTGGSGAAAIFRPPVGCERILAGRRRWHKRRLHPRCAWRDSREPALSEAEGRLSLAWGISRLPLPVWLRAGFACRDAAGA